MINGISVFEDELKWSVMLSIFFYFVFIFYFLLMMFSYNICYKQVKML